MNRKTMILIGIGGFILLISLIGATYAYFVVNASNDFGTVNIESSFDEIGSVALSGGSNLTLSLTATDMMNKGVDTNYYASSSGTTTTETEETIGEITVVGNGTYSCNYTLTMDDNSSSMYDAFQNMTTKSDGQIILTINGVDYDFNDSDLFPKTISGNTGWITSSNPRKITASLKLVNKTEINQDDISGTSITITFTASNFNCTAVDQTLPSEYQAVEYIESTGTQIIDTGYMPNNNTSVDYDFEFISGSTGLWIPILGQRVDYSELFAIWIKEDTRNVAFNYGKIDTSAIENTNGEGRHLYEIKENKFYIDETFVVEVNKSIFQTDHSLFVFALNTGNSTYETRDVNGRVYSLDIYENGEMVRNYIPCYRKSDGVVGLYDLVNNQFYVNKGTGTFGKGNDI